MELLSPRSVRQTLVCRSYLNVAEAVAHDKLKFVELTACFRL